MVDGGDQEDAPAAAEDAPAPAEDAPVAAPGRRLRGYAVGAAVVALAVVGAIALLAGGDGTGSDQQADAGDGPPKPGDVLPAGGLFPIPDEDVESLSAAAAAAGCELESYHVEHRDHVPYRVRYPSSPPTSGNHAPMPAPDGAYEVSPDVMQLVHTLEHSRVIVWFKRDLPRKARAALKAFYDHDPFLLVLVPDTTDMTYAVAATAWNRNPRPRGTGRLLGCPEYNVEMYTALELFKNRHRGRGPEVIP